MNNLAEKQNPLIPLHEENDGSVAVMGRDLHEFLEIGTEYSQMVDEDGRVRIC